MATDQEIRDAGFKYIPQQQYLQNPFELPTTPEEEPVINQGIVNTNAFTGGRGNDFSVYNPDPNSIINRNYQPNYDYRKSVDYNPELSDLQNQKIMQGTANFKGYDYYNKPELTGPQKFLQFASSFMPGSGAAGLISPYLPVNSRRIFENELGGKGIMVNNIGQVVQGKGDYNTAENVMAGYNADLITQKTIDKRQGKIEDTLRDKYEMTDADINAVKAGTYDGPVKSDLIGRYSAVGEYGDINNLTRDESDDIYDFEKDRKKKKRDNDIIGRYFKKRKEQKEIDLQKEIAAANLKAAQDAQAARGPSYRNIASGDMGSDGQTPGGTGGNVTTTGGDTYGGATLGGYNEAAEKTDYYARGGRVGYFFGGRVNFKHGGLASIL